MVNPWFCKIEGEETGPFSGATLREMVADGKVTPETHVRRGDSTRWVQAAQVQGLLAPLKAAAKPASASSSKLNLKRARSLETPPKPTVPPPVAGPPPPVEAASLPAKGPAAAAPAPPRDSQAIPTGTPVGVAVGSAAVPRGEAVAPAGMATSAAHHDDDYIDPIEARRRKKKMQQLLMVVGLIGGFVLLAGGGIAYALLGGGGSPEIAENPIVPPADDESSANTAEPTADEQAAAAAESEQDYAVQELLAAVGDKEWRDISPRRTISMPDMYKLKVTEAWLSDDPLGGHVLDPKLVLDPGSGSSASAAQEKQPDEEVAEAENLDDIAALLAQSRASIAGDKPPPTADDPAENPAKRDPAARYLIVALEVTNIGKEPLRYMSWNPISGEEIAASLIANEKTEIKALTRKEAAGPGRSGPQDLQPGESLVDHLVFAAPARPVGSLKLLLPKDALGREGMYGFLVTAEILAARYEMQLAEAQEKEPPEEAIVAEPLPANATAPPTAVATEEPAPEEPKPLTQAEIERLEFEALRKDIEGAAEEKP